MTGAGRPQDPVPGPAAEGWFVLIEETVGGSQAQRWRLTHIRPFPDRATAHAEAVAAAKWYEPEHPKQERRRMVFQTGEDVWTVWVEGMFSDFHFRVSVTRLLAG